MTDRPVLDVPTPPSGWLYPWPNVAEIAAHVGPTEWTLVGGLMVALHAAHRGIALPRTTVDVDMVVHVETARGRVAHVAGVLTRLGYALVEPTDARKGLAHRFTRTAASGPDDAPDVVDVMVADHPAPSVLEKLGRFRMVGIDGGTQALQRTVNARLDIAGETIEVSVPDALGAAMLKSAAYLADSRDKARHLADAAVLLACMADPFAERERLTSGSDGRRLRVLDQHLSDGAHPAWLALDGDSARDGQAALRILLG